jgi:hypothetical protein
MSTSTLLTSTTFAAKTNTHHHGKLNTSNSTGSLTNVTNNISSISSIFHKHMHQHIEVENAGEIKGHLDPKSDA